VRAPRRPSRWEVRGEPSSIASPIGGDGGGDVVLGVGRRGWIGRMDIVAPQIESTHAASSLTSTVTFIDDLSVDMCASASATPGLLGPLVGGLLADTLSWRAAFLVNLPLLAVASWTLLRHTPESRDQSATGGLDWTLPRIGSTRDCGRSIVVSKLIEGSLDVGRRRHEKGSKSIPGGRPDSAVLVVRPCVVFGARARPGSNGHQVPARLRHPRELGGTGARSCACWSTRRAIILDIK